MMLFACAFFRHPGPLLASWAHTLAKKRQKGITQLMQGMADARAAAATSDGAVDLLRTRPSDTSSYNSVSCDTM